MWGYSEAGKPFQHPGPVLCVNQGDTVTVILQNTFAEADVSIIFPGQEDVLADGCRRSRSSTAGAIAHLADQRGAGRTAAA